ncbi:Ig-like domain-containing protein [Staphylococcus gallinarum]|uniref:Ig-like domain-containing protein n=1 Tax=Staphylococcus gallinarum TaxID=1293 RepID=UPI001E5A5509|nr:Ig-like domain-containing protein [Staphylococcus gallinarum]MCD8917160.1 hypothetical protein [Staphylococcus gallinarum]
MKENSNKILKFLSLGTTVVSISIGVTMLQDSKVHASEITQNDMTVSQKPLSQENASDKEPYNTRTYTNNQFRTALKTQETHIQQNNETNQNKSVQSENTTSSKYNENIYTINNDIKTSNPNVNYDSPKRITESENKFYQNPPQRTQDVTTNNVTVKSLTSNTNFNNSKTVSDYKDDVEQETPQNTVRNKIAMTTYSSNINYNDSGVDIDAPTILNVTTDKKTYKPGETVKFTIESKDESSIEIQKLGIQSTRYKEDYRYDPIIEELKSTSFFKNNNGNWVSNFSYVLPSRIPNDEFEITSIFSQDIYENNKYSFDWSNIGFNVVNSTNSDTSSTGSNINYNDSGVDIDAPTILNVTTDKKTYKPGETVKFTIESKDESRIEIQKLGIESTRYKEDYRYKPTLGDLKSTSFFKNSNGNWVSNFSYVLPSRIANDEFKISSIYSQDIHGNNKYNFDWSNVGFNVVNSTNNDTTSTDAENSNNPGNSTSEENTIDNTKPMITSVSVSSTTFDINQRYYVTANATDDGGSGINSVTAYFINTKTNEIKSYQLSKSYDGLYTENIYLSSHYGPWELDYLVARDNAQNQYKYQYRIPITNKPIIKTPTITNNVSDNSNYIIGKADSEMEVIVKANGNVIASGNANYIGNYALIIPKQIAGTVLSVIAVDKDGNESSPYTVTLEDKTPPNIPIIKSITEKSTSVNGMAEPNSVIRIKVNNKIIAEGKSNINGAFNINIPILKANQIVQITATDKFGNESNYLDYTVQDVTSPNAPKLQPINDRSNQIIGTGEANTTVLITNGNKLVAKGKVSNDGTFSIPIPLQTPGIILNVTLDDGTNTSESKTMEVTGTTKPKAPTVNKVSDQSITISGKSINNVTIYAMINDKIIGKTVVKNGSYSIGINKQKAGTKINIYAIDKYKNQSIIQTVNVSDTTPPKSPSINNITTKSKVITGKGEVGSTVYIYNGNKKIGQAIVDKNGTYKINIKSQKKGTKLKIYALDKAKNKSIVQTVSVNNPIPPISPSFNKITTKSKVVTGKGAIGSTVYIYNGNKKIGQAIVDKNGTYKINIKKQKKGTKLKIYALDKAKIKSMAVYTTVK